MLSAGKRVTDQQSQLVRVTTDYLYSRIKDPDPEVEALIHNLRLAHSIDRNRYNQLKRNLPFVVCAKFSPAYRKTENFASVDCFIVDIDHISAAGMAAYELKSKLCSDSHVTMCFLSPSGDGLKLLFTLKEKCYDAGEFSSFYKVFCKAIRNRLRA